MYRPYVFISAMAFLMVIAAILSTDGTSGHRAAVSALSINRASVTHTTIRLHKRTGIHDAALQKNVTTPIQRIASRLSGRLIARGMPSPSIPVLMDAVHQRSAIMRRSFTVQLDASMPAASGVTIPTEWSVSLSSRPLWGQYTFGPLTARFDIVDAAIAEDLSTSGIPGIQAPHDATVVSVANDGRVDRTVVEGKPLGGFTFDVVSLSRAIAAGLRGSESEHIRLPMVWREGTVTYNDGTQTYLLELLARGRSNFKGSPFGRKENVRKAMNEKLNGVLIPAGRPFSFNNMLGGPVLQSTGWSMALGIFEGENLRPVPGGGICQASTTLYRAILQAGLPVHERRAHSLYVTYYKAHGVGIDATIFPGNQDLVFTNDTSAPILLHSFTDGDDATAELYGISDGRTVELAGPYFQQNAPEGLTVRSREIAWLQQIHTAGGQTITNTVLSRYKTLPRALHAEFSQPQAITVTMR